MEHLLECLAPILFIWLSVIGVCICICVNNNVSKRKIVFKCNCINLLGKNHIKIVVEHKFVVSSRYIIMSKVQPEYICSCFFTQNIFIKKYKIHVKYINDDQFENEFRQVLRMKGCSTTNQYEEALYEVHKEVSLRKSYHKKFLDNYLYIQRHYTKLYPDIWTLRQTFLDSRFLTIAAEAKKPTQTKESLLSCIMHNGGDITGSYISLDEMGLSQGLLIPLIADYLQFIAKCLFPQWTGHAIDSFKAFVVKYESDLDTELSKHFDNAEVTMNISLNSKFEGGDLQFYSSSLNRSVDISHESNLQMSHKEGYGVMHCGRQYHSALPIIAGIRYNLIIWMRSSTVRNICPMCNQTPDLVQVPIAGDGFIPIPKTRSQCHLL